MAKVNKRIPRRELSKCLGNRWLIKSCSSCWAINEIQLPECVSFQMEILRCHYEVNLLDELIGDELIGESRTGHL